MPMTARTIAGDNGRPRYHTVPHTGMHAMHAGQKLPTPVQPAATIARSSGAARGLSCSLSLCEVARSFGKTTALHALTLHVRAGEFVSILGPSGSGKSTTLNLIAGFDYPTAGSIRMNGEDVTSIPPYRRGIGMVFQNYALFPHLTVFENIAFPLRSRGSRGADIERGVKQALGLVQLDDVTNRLPRQLSGGQQQRVALARAIVYRPKILLMDEPLGALDRKLRADMQLEIKRLHRELGTTILYVTHDQDEALSMSDRIAVLNAGRLEQCATPRELYDRPATVFVAGFVGETNLVPATVGETGLVAHLAGLDLEVPLAGRRAASGSIVTVSLRPEHIIVVGDGASGVPAVVEDVLFLGDTVICVLGVGGAKLVAKLQPGGTFVPGLGNEVRVAANVAAATVFDTKGRIDRSLDADVVN
jgi:putative spermidine/putrescine transport system ATP-binding protein